MTSSSYIDGFLLAVPRAKLEDYRAIASKCSAIWKEFGAIDYVESAMDDESGNDMRSFRAAAEAGEDEIVIFSWIVYPSKEVRDEANRRIMSDPRIAESGEECQKIFDCARMAYGGFKPIVAL